MIDELSKFNLNRLVVLYAILEEKNITNAASRLHISPTAVSNSLKLLRDEFEDKLLVRVSSKQSILTGKAKFLQPYLRSLLLDASRIYTAQKLFVPATSKGRFKIGMVEPASIVLSDILIKEVMERAPGVHIELSQISMDMDLNESLELGYDFLIAPSVTKVDMPRNYSSKSLYAAELSLFLRKDHPLLGKDDIGKELLNYPLLRLAGKSMGIAFRYVMRNLCKTGFEISTEEATKVVVSSYLEAISIIMKTDSVGILGRHAMLRLKDNFECEEIPIEMTISVPKMHVFWREDDINNQAVNWMIDLLIELTRKLNY